MNPDEPESQLDWMRRMATIAGSLSQDQIDAVQYLLGYPVTGDHEASWTPTRLVMSWHQSITQHRSTHQESK